MRGLFFLCTTLDVCLADDRFVSSGLGVDAPASLGQSRGYVLDVDEFGGDARDIQAPNVGFVTLSVFSVDPTWPTGGGGDAGV